MKNSPHFSPDYEVVIVGASYAGLSAALVLGRARRRVLVLDGGPPCNAAAWHTHGLLTRDGAAPQEILRIARQQLKPYPVTVLAATATSAHVVADGRFAVVLADQTTLTANALVLATGLADTLPDVPGLAPLWGRGVFHCPYCHGWEVRHHARVAVYGGGPARYEFARTLRHWNPRLLLVTDGPAHLDAAQLAQLRHDGTEVIETPVAALKGTIRGIMGLAFHDGSHQAVDALFVATTPRQHSPLPAQLGCATAPEGVFVTADSNGLTSVPGVYAVGDLAGPAHQLVLAAASGYRAGEALNQAFIAGANAANAANAAPATTAPAASHPPTPPPRRNARRQLHPTRE